MRLQTLLLVLMASLCWPGLTLAQQRDCYNLMNEVLGTDARVFARLSVQNPISDYLSSAPLLVRTFLREQGQEERCRRTFESFSRWFGRYYERRLHHSLETSGTDQFFAEYRVLAAPRVLEMDRRALAALLNRFERLYVERAQEELLISLRDTPWAHYSEIQREIHPWSEHITEELGRAAPGAVDLETHDISIQVFDRSPLEVRFFIFHEFSHLSDPERYQA